MTKVFHHASPRADNRVHTPAQSSTPAIADALRGILLEVTPGLRPFSTDSYLPAHLVEAAQTALTGDNMEPIPGTVERQAAIENALSMALYFIRQPGDSAANLWAATARANRAFTLLKQASQGNAPASTANAPCNSFGRA